MRHNKENEYRTYRPTADYMQYVCRNLKWKTSDAARELAERTDKPPYEVTVELDDGTLYTYTTDKKPDFESIPNMKWYASTFGPFSYTAC